MSYIGNQPVLQTTQFRDEFPVTASTQTAFYTGGFHPSAVSVYRNGVLLSEDDYTKGSDNVTITLNNAAVSGDIVVIEGNRSLAQGVSVSESRVEHTWQANDTVVQLNADVVPFYSDVYLNGVKLAAADYSINTVNRTVSFTSAPAVGDVIAVVHRNETSALVGLPLKDSSGAAILSESAGSVVLANVDTATIGSNALVVDSSGNVGVGTSSPSADLDLGMSQALVRLGANDGAINQSTIEFGSDAVKIYRNSTAGANDLTLDTYTNLRFTYRGTERMRIDSSGDVFVYEEVRVGTNGRTHIRGGGIYDDNTNGNDVGIGFTGSAIIPTNGTGSAINNSKDVGSSTYKWDDVYATNGTIQTSDANEKESITTSDLSIDFIKQLNPVSYRFIGKTRTHYGLIAQEIETLLSAIGKETTDFAGFIKSPVTDEDGNETGEFTYGLRYSEFISPMIKAIQEQQTLIESQQSQIDALTARIEALEATP